MKLICLLALLLLLTGCVSFISAQTPPTAPYPNSSVITSVTFDWNQHVRLADGSDNWPVTWASDGHQYTSWGDGGGFGGTNSNGRVSLGFGRIEGSATAYQGFNVWGGLNPENPAQFEGKSYGIVSVGGVLYAWVSPDTNMQSYNEARMSMSLDNGATWTQASWAFTKADDTVFPTILNFGQDYAGARDSFVYSYFIRLQDDTSLQVQTPGIIDLARVPQTDLMTQSSYEWFAGLDVQGNPTWTANITQRQPVFQDSNGVGWTVAASYNPTLGRYLLTTEHIASFQGNLGIFDAPEPWGPWTTVEYVSGFGANVGGGVFFWNFANKWQSGNDFTLVFSGVGVNDSWNTVQGSFNAPVPTPTPNPTATPTPTPSGGLVAHWSFENNCLDGAGSNDCTLFGNAGFSAGQVGQGLLLDGADDYAQVGDNVNIGLDGATEASWLWWMQPDTLGQNNQGRPIDKAGGSGVDSGYAINLSNGNALELQVNRDGGEPLPKANNIVTLNELHHYAVTWDSVTGISKFYKNGVLVHTDNSYVDGAIRGNAHPLKIGQRATDSNRDFDGLIDELRVYDIALSDAEVLSVYNAELGAPPPTPTPTPTPTATSVPPPPTPTPHPWLDQQLCDDNGVPIVGCATGIFVGWIRSN